MPVVFVLVDALRHDYLAVHQSAPFLSSCAEKGVCVEKVNPSLGFCERVEILTGVGFPENGYFSAIGRKKKQVSPYGILKVLPSFLAPHPFVRKVIKRVTRNMGLRLQPYEIPFAILPELVLTEDATDHQKTGAFGVESLVDVFAAAGKKISWHYAALGLQNGTDEDRIAALKAAFFKQAADLYMLYVSPLDSIAHKYGPLSKETGRALRDVDKTIRDLFNDLKKNDPSVTLVVLGDHGMAEVRQTLDAENLLREVAAEMGLRPWKDFKYFLDSTTCRIWGESDQFEKQAVRFIKRVEKILNGTGSWLTGTWDKALYGDYIWICSEGVLVFPDFFHRKGDPYKGMHGYVPEGFAMRGFGLIYSEDGRVAPKRIQEGSLSDLADTLCDLVEVRPPEKSGGRSWIDQE